MPFNRATLIVPFVALVAVGCVAFVIATSSQSLLGIARAFDFSIGAPPRSAGDSTANTAAARGSPVPGSTKIGITADWLTPELLRVSPGAAGSIDRNKYLVFRLAVDAMPDKLSIWDLKGMVFLDDGGGKEYGTPIWMPIDGKTALMGFPNRDSRGNPVPAVGSRYLEIVIRGLDGTNDKRFRWEFTK